MKTFTRYILVGISFFITITGCFSIKNADTTEIQKSQTNMPQLVQAAPVSEALNSKILYMDSLLFDAAFINCNADVVAQFIHDDFEFYHDEHGLIATKGVDFIDRIRNDCAARALSSSNNYPRRALIWESHQVYGMNNFGALQTGIHRFYQVEPGKVDQLTSEAQFSHLWKQTDEGWKIIRVFSYDHKNHQ